jgi:LytS/YehU family sensor histidine kinase
VRAARLEIDLLKQKIQPHFMMNTLTALSEWIESSPATAVRMIGALAAELRSVAAMSDATLVPMRQELDLCRHHLVLMAYRINQDYELRADNVDPDGLIPPAVFHTLIENSLTRNPSRIRTVFKLSEATQGSQRTYILRSPFSSGSEAKRGNGTGHAYVRARLRAAFGEQWRFQSREEDGEWIGIVTVPCAS